MFSIIIPVHNQSEMTQACIESIVVNTDDYEIIIVDNGSSQKVDIDFYYAELPVKMISNTENLGFPKAVNQGIEAANGDVVVILNNDVIVTPHWLEKLQWHLSNGLDMVGPCTNSISGPQQVLISQYSNEQELNTAAMAFQLENALQSIPFHRLVFYCVAIKKEVIDKVGLLDEIYTPGNFEDDDFCMRAIEAGFKLGIAKDCYVHHFGGVTQKAMNLDYQALLRKNQQIFNDKWGEKYERLKKQGSDKIKIALITANLGQIDPDIQSQHIKQNLPDDMIMDYFYLNDDNFPLRINAMSPRLQAKIPRMAGWMLKPGYDYYIWMDSIITLKNRDTVQWLVDQCSGFDMAMFEHPERKNIREEFVFMRQQMDLGNNYLIDRYTGEPMQKQVRAYLEDKTFKDDKLYSSGVFIYRNCEVIKRCLSMWLLHCTIYSIQDQLSFSYVSAKTKCRVNQIKGDIRGNKYVKCHHIEREKNAE